MPRIAICAIFLQVIFSNVHVNLSLQGLEVDGGTNSQGSLEVLGPTADGDPVVSSSTTIVPPIYVPLGSIPVAQTEGSVLLQAGDLYQFSSSGFGVTYSQREISNWKFQGNQCSLNATCPCVDIPPSKECLTGYLKLRTGPLYDFQRFCGGNKPSNFSSNANRMELNVRYRSTISMRPSTGFTCFISCVQKGVAIKVPPPVVCPGPY